MFFELNMIQSSYDLQAGLITDFLRIANHTGAPPHDSCCHIASRLLLRFADTTAISRSCFTVVIVDNAVQYSTPEVPLRSIDASHRPLTAAGG